MALPKLSQPIFTLTMPSSGKKVKYRQFTVKEEKILLTAQASGGKEDMIEAFKQLITNCCLDDIDVDKMPAFDIEYFFLQLRAKSVSDVIKLSFTEEDGEKAEAEIKLSELQVHKPTVSNKVLLSEEQGIGVVLRYPTFSMIEKMADLDDKDPTTSLQLFKMIIESIYDADAVYPSEDSAPGELDEFVLSLNNLQVSKIQAFLEDMPYVYIDVKYTVKGVEKEQRVRGMENFFV
ncbi:baseplate hub subunit protein [Stenotrophomonas phage vB_SmaS-DLP_6]|nr:baseplate hub subunit protein [Stenotrophomonas phage vB_SmaS-DLP_6]